MSRIIPLQELEVEIQKELSAYSLEVAEEVKSELTKASKSAVQEIKALSPRDSGEYASGWKVKKEFESSNDIRLRIYNAKKPQLTHLLENGHAKVGGGRVPGKVHIWTVEQKLIKEVDANVKAVIVK